MNKKPIYKLADLTLGLGIALVGLGDYESRNSL